MPEKKESFLRAVQILTIALATGVAVFYILALVLSLIGFIETNPLQAYSRYIVIGLGVVSFLVVIASFRFFNKKIESIKNSTESIQARLNLYRSALIIFFAATEGIALFSIIFLLISGNYWFSVIMLFMLAAMISKFPTRQKVIEQLGLDWNEQQEL